MNYTFTAATHNDLPTIMNIYRSLIGQPGCTWSLDYPNEEIIAADIAEQALYMLKDGDAIIAVAAIIVVEEFNHLPFTIKKPCDLARIGVIQPMQGKGIGKLILHKVMAEAKKKGYGGVRLLVSKTNPTAISLYENNEFTRCGETFMFDIDWFCYQLAFN